MRNFLKETKENILVYDGSKGTMLQQMGLKGGDCPELWNATHSEEVKQVYSLYKNAGSDVIQTNTFQGNRLKLEEYSLGERTYELNFESVRLAREVMGRDGFVAASIGPLGKLFEPSGELTFEVAYETFKEQVQAVVDGGADIINFETFTDLAEMRAALIAAKETTDIPVICSIAFEANGRTLMGTDPYIAAVVLKSLGADMIGTNCSLGAEHLIDIVKKMYEAGGIYISVKPNAGLPEFVDGKTVYNETPENFAKLAGEFVKYGVRLIGGCCGTTPDYIEALKAALKGVEVPKINSKSEHIITSNTKLINIDSGEKYNFAFIDAPKDEELCSELGKGNLDYITDVALDISCGEYDGVYVNVDGISEDVSLLEKVVNMAQGYAKQPFVIETKNSEALNRALRIYKGKAGVVVNGYTGQALEELLVVAKKYGSTIVDKGILLG